MILRKLADVMQVVSGITSVFTLALALPSGPRRYVLIALAVLLLATAAISWIASHQQRKEIQALTLSQREQQIKQDLKQLKVSEMAVLQFILQWGTVRREQVFRYMDEQELQGRPMDTLLTRTGFILAVGPGIDQRAQLTINPEFKDALTKILV